MQPVDFAAGNWYRASRYEVIDGSIVPAPDSEIEVYDPWEGSRLAKPIQGVAVPRYQALLELVQKLETTPVQQPPRSRKREPLRGGNSAGEKLILTWCQKFGLLGILPTLATFVRLAPRWGPLEHLDRAGAAGLCAHQDVMIRIGGAWWSQVIPSDGNVYDVIPQSARTLGGLVPADLISGRDRPSVVLWDGVLTTELGFPHLKEQRLAETWWRFFPAAYRSDPETFHYPWIGSEGFRREYGEPLWMFERAARLFKQCVEILGGPGHTAEDLFGAKAFLNFLASAVSPRIDSDPSSHLQEWNSASLLASFAFMAIQDRTLGHRLYYCKNHSCRRIFISNSAHAAYCSAECRSVFHTRQYRAKIKAEKARARRKMRPKLH